MGTFTGALSDALDSAGSSLGNILNWNYGGGQQQLSAQENLQMGIASMSIASQQQRFQMLLLIGGAVVLILVVAK